MLPPVFHLAGQRGHGTPGEAIHGGEVQPLVLAENAQRVRLRIRGQRLGLRCRRLKDLPPTRRVIPFQRTVRPADSAGSGVSVLPEPADLAEKVLWLRQCRPLEPWTVGDPGIAAGHAPDRSIQVLE